MITYYERILLGCDVMQPAEWLITFRKSYDLHLQGSALRNVGNHLPDDTVSKLLGTQFQ